MMSGEESIMSHTHLRVHAKSCEETCNCRLPDDSAAMYGGNICTPENHTNPASVPHTRKHSAPETTVPPFQHRKPFPPHTHRITPQVCGHRAAATVLLLLLLLLLLLRTRCQRLRRHHVTGT